MPQGKSAYTHKPKLLRATLLAGTLAALGFSLIALLAAWSLYSGPPVSGPEVQGGVILLIHPAAATLFVLVAFPAIAGVLARRGRFTKLEFNRQVLAWVTVASLVPGAFLAAIGFGAGAFVLVPVSFLLLSICVLPLRAVWFRWAQ